MLKIKILNYVVKINNEIHKDVIKIHLKKIDVGLFSYYYTYYCPKRVTEPFKMYLLKIYGLNKSLYFYT